MAKVYALNFETSEEELFNWIKNTPNADELIKGFIKNQIENGVNHKCTAKASIEDIINFYTDDKSKRQVGINGEMSKYRK